MLFKGDGAVGVGVKLVEEGLHGVFVDGLRFLDYHGQRHPLIINHPLK